jgi:hypothetical protein
MAFASGDWVRVIQRLFLPVSKRGEVLTALTAAEAYPELETAVKAVLTELDAVNQKLNDERSSGGSALIQADVLRWESGQKIKDLERQRLELQSRLANLLGIEWGVVQVVGTGSRQPIQVIL